MQQVIKSAYIFSLLLLVAITSVQAQIDDIGGDVDVPIDGGLSLLVAAGVGYGAKKLKEKRKSTSTSTSIK
jgi:hypothetical protein